MTFRERWLAAVEGKNSVLYGCPDLMPGRMHGELPRISFRGRDENGEKE
jgi:hypothetical protein